MALKLLRDALDPDPIGLDCPPPATSFSSSLPFLPSFLSLVASVMPATASRAVLRQSQFLTRRTAVRHASSSSEAASKASEKASSTASKASEGLSRVSSSAGPALSNAAQGLGGALKKVGGRTGKVISFVECKRKPFSREIRTCFFTSWVLSMVAMAREGFVFVAPRSICLLDGPMFYTRIPQYYRLYMTDKKRCWFSYDTPYALLLESRT